MKFLRLDEQLDNLKLEPISLNEFNSSFSEIDFFEISNLNSILSNIF